MSSHLSIETLSSLADGELHAQELAAAQEHLAGCSVCTSNALAHMLLKSSAARASQRYETPPHLANHLSALLARERAEAQVAPPPAQRSGNKLMTLEWTAAAVLLVAAALSSTWFLAERDTRQKITATVAENTLAGEVLDQHVATLASVSGPQVLSSDNHTVKPWFQGRLSFAFNLPESLPQGMVLDGANLTYLRNEPAAQLLFSIGRHRVSVFVMKRQANGIPSDLPPERSGFHVMSFQAGELEGIAVSDVNPTRLAELVSSLEQAQSSSRDSAR